MLLGLRFSIGNVLTTGWAAIAVILGVIATAFGVTFLLMRAMGTNRRLGLLIGIGTAIRGNSAIAAAAPVLDVDEEEVSFASAVITLFGMAAMLVYPAVGHLLGLSQDAFGFLAGAGVHDPAQAIASGFTYGAEAGGKATIMKLTRTAFLVPLIVGLSVATRRRASQ